MTFYEILGCNKNASLKDIKESFRILALKHHPDRNRNSPESTVRFQRINNAYQILSNTEKRAEYDEYLKYAFSTKYRETSPLLNGNSPETGQLSEIKKEINYILWEIEDLLKESRTGTQTFKKNRGTIEQYCLLMLHFFDRWILEETGFQDYFFEARKLQSSRSSDTVKHFKEKGPHLPYTSIENYFYEIRKRSDKFINSKKNLELLKQLTTCQATLLSAITEFQMMSYHYLSHLNRYLKETTNSVPPYSFSNNCFDDADTRLLT